MRGRPPQFFEGDAKAFAGLRFNLDDESFEFYSPAKMGSDPTWVDVTELFRKGLGPHIAALMGDPNLSANVEIFLSRLNRLHEIQSREFHSETITGADKTVEVVVDIFNRVNSGGTKLSKGDLALAKICAEWTDARSEMRTAVAKWGDVGYAFSLDWLLRNVNAVATGRAPFSALDGIEPEQFEAALGTAVKCVSKFLDAAAGRLGLDHDRVLMGRYAIPVVVRYLAGHGGQFPDAAVRDRFLYWYVHAALWGRFSGSTETVLAQDLETVATEGVDGLIATMAKLRGGALTIAPHEFEGFGRGSRVYPLLYLLTRVGSAQDLGSGLPLKAQLLGHLSSLQVHHIFPKALLYDAGYTRGEVNAVANFCLLTQDTNLDIGKRYPREYLTEVEEKHPGALASQWIPTDESLWELEKYGEFLEARRELLASAADSFLSELHAGIAAADADELPRVGVAREEPPDDRQELVQGLVDELMAAGFAQPLLDVEVPDPESGRVLAVAEAFWPGGLQHGLGAPVVLEMDPDEADLPRLEALGYELYTSIEALRSAVVRLNEVAAGLAPEPYSEGDV